jgi:hypothetical protein
LKLSSEQIENIKGIIDHGGITMQSLKDDVLDHLCCVIEIKISRGKSFDEAVSESVHELAPNGLEEIQHETVFLLNSNKIILMKKVMYFIGLLATMAFVAGWSFRILHLPGADQLMGYGFLGFVFIFLPMIAMDYFKVNIHRALTEKLKFWLGFSSGVVIAISTIFKFLHLQGTTTLFVMGMVLFIFGFLPFLFFTMYKKSVA